MVDQRVALERLITERGADYTSLSRMIGRNPAYIQQFIKRGSPKELKERDRKLLADYFGVDERSLGGSGAPLPTTTQVARIPRLDVGASAGFGALHDEERVASGICFDKTWLRRLCAARPEDLSIIRVEGDSMSPTLVDGDEIMVNIGDGASRLRDGIYVLRRDDALLVKRVAINPATHHITVKSDNAAYPLWPDCRPADLTIIGRVVWTGRKVS
ncbi:helix-turn-helix transcriptional regulator [uncultured Sphingomonas sp.]|uniref:S24 family peptidase n=1 Tax=uncultured Sphingomonas sp. TaxID=158754 RepID=UPI0035CB57D9